MKGCIIQARMGSKRLPGKVLMKIDEKTVLDYVIEQIKFCKSIEKIIIATTDKPEDKEIINFAKSRNIDFFVGSENDVLDRYYQCAKYNEFDEIIRITSDNPLIDPIIVDNLTNLFSSSLFDYISNFYPPDKPTFPHGTNVEIFSMKSFKKVWDNSNDKYEREHVTPYYYNNPKLFKIYGLKNFENLSHYRFTVDTEKDLQIIKIITSKIKKRPILMNDVINLFKKKS